MIRNSGKVIESNENLIIDCFTLFASKNLNISESAIDQIFRDEKYIFFSFLSFLEKYNLYLLK